MCSRERKKPILTGVPWVKLDKGGLSLSIPQMPPREYDVKNEVTRGTLTCNDVIWEQGDANVSLNPTFRPAQDMRSEKQTYRKRRNAKASPVPTSKLNEIPDLLPPLHTTGNFSNAAVDNAEEVPRSGVRVNVPSISTKINGLSVKNTLKENCEPDVPAVALKPLKTPTPPVLVIDDYAIDKSELATATTTWDPSDMSVENDLNNLKVMTQKLKLVTRRPSYVEWQKKYLNSQLGEGNEARLPGPADGCSACSGVNIRSDWSLERKSKIDSALEWLRRELSEMRMADHKLARQLMNLRRDIHRVKLQRSCDAHQGVLEEAFEQLEDEREETSELSDSLPDQLSPTLRQFGVTRLHLSTRRFSVF